MDFISALKSVQIRSLVNAGDLQLSLFDEVNLAEITSPLFPGERLVVCRNPAVAAERARKRTELLAATELELAKVKASVDGPRGRLRGADAGQIGERAGLPAQRLTVHEPPKADGDKCKPLDSARLLSEVHIVVAGLSGHGEWTLASVRRRNLNAPLRPAPVLAVSLKP